MYEIKLPDILPDLRFSNDFIDQLPGDPDTSNTRRQVHNACYSLVDPTPVAKPQLIACSNDAARLLDLGAADCNSESFLHMFSGNRLSRGMQPFAMCYGGHQFGSWAGQLGDGRAINLGEIINQAGERWVLQLKGAGPTPYSRSADGLAVLRSSLREFVCSEAMHYLAIPTTRALSLILSGELVERDMFYNGNPKDEPGAIVCRLSPSFIRFGTFELFAVRQEYDVLQQLVDYTIKVDFPHLPVSAGKDTYLLWLTEICDKTARLIADWMRVGFVHGVMNTDNMSILGLTIDYGPYGWLEGYDPTWTPNTTDAQGRRYCYGNQPHIGQWNLVQLAQALYPLIEDTKPLQEAVDTYRTVFQDVWQRTLHGKLGLDSYHDTDSTLINDLFELLREVETDMTIFFRKLADIDDINLQEELDGIPHHLTTAYYQPADISQAYVSKLRNWLKRYQSRLSYNSSAPEARKHSMNRVNPKYVFRNYLAQLAIDKVEQGDNSMVHELLEVLKHPYDDQPGKELYEGKRPEWARNRPGCSMLSCSS